MEQLKNTDKVEIRGSVVDGKFRVAEGLGDRSAGAETAFRAVNAPFTPADSIRV